MKIRKHMTTIAGALMLSAVALSAHSFAETKVTIPPFYAPPADATPVMVKVELQAKDAASFKAYLESANVIPTTRLASGIKYSWSTQHADDPTKFTLLQEWTSASQHQSYIQWRVDTGALKELTDQLAVPPVVTYLNVFDDNTLPAQVSVK
jgi:quinol monooxygenase YgiN